MFLPLVISALLVASPVLAVSDIGVGTLTVEVRDSALRTSVPPGSQRVPMSSFVFSASCQSDVLVEGMQVYHRGLGAQQDVLSVYALVDGRRLGRARSITNRDGRVFLRFRRFIIPACGTSTVVLYANFSASASVAGEHRLELRSESDVLASVPVFLRRSSTNDRFVRTSGRTVGSVAFEYVDLTSPIRYGRNRLVSRFRLEADRTDHHLIRSIRMRNLGSAQGMELQNLFLESNRRERLTRVTPFLDGDFVQLVFDPPFLLKKSHKKLFGLRADVRAKSRKTIQFVIEEPGDIDAVTVRGRSVGF